MPRPDADSQRHSERVADYLRAAIVDGGGSLSFGEFMQHALYAPGLGYYNAGTRKFGADGDFVTAPEVSPLFGNVLARQIAPLLKETGKETGNGDLLELGPGSGALMTQLLKKLGEFDALPGRYRILEVSPELRERQQQRVQAELPALADRVEWLDRLPMGFNGVVVANEVADALPVERFLRTADGVGQMRVVADRERFDCAWEPAPRWLRNAVTAIETGLGKRLPEGYVSDLSPGLRAWIGDIADCLERAFVFLFDYGLARHEYYAPDRSGGWLRCHFRHRAHDDPFCYPGIQDITSWVDFTAVAEAAVASGLDVAGYLTQSHFLLGGGLIDELASLGRGDAALPPELSRQVKLLTLPGEMGEHFKCLGMTRGAVTIPRPFTAADRSHVL